MHVQQRGGERNSLSQCLVCVGDSDWCHSDLNSHYISIYCTQSKYYVFTGEFGVKGGANFIKLN